MEIPQKPEDLLEGTAREFLSYSFLLDSWLHNADGKILSDGETVLAVNEETTAIFGYHRSQMIDKPIDNFVPARFREAHVNHRAGYKAHPKNRSMSDGAVLAGLRSDGVEFPAVISLLRHYDALRGLLVEVTVRVVTE